jgi:hypothetical protein
MLGVKHETLSPLNESVEVSASLLERHKGANLTPNAQHLTLDI